MTRHRYKRVSTHYCSYCGDGILPGRLMIDARIPGTYHASCLFKAVKMQNPEYQKAKTA